VGRAIKVKNEVVRVKVGQALFWFILGGIVVGAITYALGWQGGYNVGWQCCYVSAPTAPTVVTPVSLDITQTGGTTFNISANVSSDGSATAVEKSLAVTIENEDNESATVQILLKNPKTGEEGLPSGLENSYFNVWAGSPTQKVYLFKDGSYTSGYTFEILPDTVMTGYIGVEVKTAPSGTFADNQTYTMEVYIYQPAANYVETISYTVLT